MNITSVTIDQSPLSRRKRKQTAPPSPRTAISTPNESANVPSVFTLKPWLKLFLEFVAHSPLLRSVHFELERDSLVTFI